MKTTTRLLLPLFVLALGIVPAFAAETRPLEFARALQERGYHDLSIDYLNLLKDRQTKGIEPMAAELADIWDLEMARSMRGAANRAYNAKVADEMTAGAQAHLDKFLKEKATHPEADSALVQFGVFVMDGALRQLRNAEALPAKEAAQKQKFLDAARTLMEDARPRFKMASDKLLARINALPSPSGEKVRVTSTKAAQIARDRARLNNAYFGALFQSGLLEFYVAQTYVKKDDPARKASLKAAGDMFNYIWQYRRVDETGRVDMIGLQAHMWEGKAREDQGDWMTALDIYDEALASVTDPEERVTLKEEKLRQKQLDPLFATVCQFRLAIIAKYKPSEYIDEAREFLTIYGKKWYIYDGFQGAALDLAKAIKSEAEKATGKEAAALKKEANEILKEMIKTPSTHQQEALNELGGGAALTGEIKAKPEELKTFDEAVLLGDACAKQEKWEQAPGFYRRALELQDTIKGKDAPTRIAAVHTQLANVEYRAINALFQEKKFSEVVDRVRVIIKLVSLVLLIAPTIALLSVWAQYNTASAATDAAARQEAQAKFEKLAQWLIDTWPGKPEADDVRMIFAQKAMERGDVKKAQEILGSVNPQSERYPIALYSSGQIAWHGYLRVKRALTDTRQEPDAATKKQMEADRKTASEKIAEAVDRFKKMASADKPAPDQKKEAEVLLVEVRLEEGNPKEAVTLLEPMIAAVKAAKDPKLDTMTQRVFMNAVRAYLALNDVKTAGEMGMILVDLGEDEPTINSVLVNFARVLDGERKKAEADRITANAKGNAQGLQDAQARLASMQTMMAALLKKLAARAQHSPLGIMHIAEMCSAIDLNAEATTMYQGLFDKAQGGDEAAAKFVTRARAALIGLMRKAGNYKEAVEQATKLAEEHKNALDPKMELARIYQAWAEQDAEQYAKAVAEWNRIRNLLEPVKRKKEFAGPYYEVIYSASYCSFQQAKKQLEKGKTDDAVKAATQAGQLLTSAVVLNPRLSGPEMVAKYNALLTEVKAFLEKHKSA